jgi:CBS domain-containing protein
MGRARLHEPTPAGAKRTGTTVKINDLMSKRVITAQPHHTVGHVRGLMQRNRILAVPVVGLDGEAVGIVTATDLIGDLKDNSPISRLITPQVYKVPAYNDISVAARMMRKHRIHHVVVTHEQAVVGIISSFDLLRLVENRRFEMKNPSRPKTPKRDAPDLR